MEATTSPTNDTKLEPGIAEYELILMLDPTVEDGSRNEFAAATKSRIEGSGSLLADDNWGVRKMAYEIEKHGESDYRYFRFRSEPPLLDELEHNLKIADSVLRFRIFKVDPRTPTTAPPELSTLEREREERSDRGERSAPAPAVQAEEAPEETGAEDAGDSPVEAEVAAE